MTAVLHKLVFAKNNNNMSVSHGNYVSANFRHDTDELEYDLKKNYTNLDKDLPT